MCIRAEQIHITKCYLTVDIVFTDTTRLVSNFGWLTYGESVCETRYVVNERATTMAAHTQNTNHRRKEDVGLFILYTCIML